LALSGRSVQPVPSGLRALLGLPVLSDLQVSSARVGLLVPQVKSGLLARPGLLARRVLLVTPGLLGRRVTPVPPGLPVTLGLPGLPGLPGLLGHPSASLSLTTHTSRAQNSSPWTARPTTPLSVAGSTSRVR
jgi:hypothetical protein